MRVGALAAVVPVFDEFLRVVPRPACVGHEHRQQLPDEDDAGQEAPQGFLVEHHAHQERGEHGQQSGSDELLLGFLRADGHDARIIRGLPPFPDGSILELRAYLVDDEKGGSADGANRQGAEQERHRTPDQKADEDQRLRDGQAGGDLGVPLPHQAGDVGDVGVEERDGRDHRRADRDPFGDGFRRIPAGIEIREGLPRSRFQVRHFADAVGVVRHRAEDIHRDVVPGQGQHPDPAHRHPIGDVGRVRSRIDEAGGEDRQGNGENRPDA